MDHARGGPVVGAAAGADDGAIAIIGLACRFPMAPDPAAFWRLLRSGTCAVTAAPPSRRAYNVLYDPAAAPDGAMPYQAGFLDSIEEFDADFFGISPREARAMDPQQRLMLEVAWEGLEDARIVPASLRGVRAGVFVGAMADDYAALAHQRGLDSITAHTMTGMQRSFIANRISYTMGLRGPSLAVDTGQSSSLVAVHLACASLCQRECDIAVAGGVQLNIAAHSTMQALSRGILSPRGVSAAFDASADGFVRGEGAGVVILKPLRQALADGDRVYCVIAGSAVNNDGDASGSLAAPGEETQREVLLAAYRRAGAAPSSVQYVELHGTGTRAGDPVEARALAAVCGTGRRREAPLLVGSVKTNIGHLEGAAGVAGLIKAVLSLVNREVPPSLHFRDQAPGIPLDEMGIAVQRTLGPWPAPAGRALSGVSSLGLGGTNCHVVLTDPPAAAAAGLLPGPPGAGHGSARRPPAALPLPWVVSGRTPGALRAHALRLMEYAEARAGLDLGDAGLSLATTRTAFEYRAAVVADARPSLMAGLRAVSEGKTAPGVLRGTVAAGYPSGRLAFLFPGQGFQRPGMGRSLHGAFPAFADAFDAACAELDQHLDRPLRDVLWAEPGTPLAGLLDHTSYTQPALFAIEVALWRLAESLGLHAGLVAGHSVGELAAAHAAGLLTLADAARLVATRGRLMQALPRDGAMIAVQASADEVAALLAGEAAPVAVAAVNGPAATVLSGERQAVERLAASIAQAGRKTRRLKVSHAFHSPLMEPALAGLEAVARDLRFQPGRDVEFVSAVTGELAAPDEVGRAEYWVEHARRPVLFARALATLAGQGAGCCLEVGPGNGLTTMGKVAWAGRDPAGSHSASQDMAFIAGMHGTDEVAALATAVAALHVRGTPIRWRALFGPRARLVDLPAYPFQRRRHWLETAAGTTPATSTPAPSGDAGTPVRQPPGPAKPAPGDPHALVTGIVASLRGDDAPGPLDITRPFRDLGFDSAMMMELAARLSEATGQDIESSLAYGYPSPGALIEHLARGPGGPDPTPARASGPAGQRATGRHEPLAIIGMACRYPGGVRSPEGLWALVREGRDGTSDFPVNRGWDLDALYDPEPGRAGRTYTRRGGFLHDADQFDAAFFGISPREAAAMDPQQRVVLETCWEALEHAGLAPDGLRGEQVGVFAGATSQDYGPRLHEAPGDSGGHLLTGTTPSVLSGRIAYVLGLRGPAVTIDTACSSSLVALHLAGRALRAGDCRLALACGVTVMASPGMFVAFSMQGGLAPDGRCKPFAAAADGTAWAEGAGVVVLERLSDARRLGHPVLAVLRGSAINQDGASNGLSAPNGQSQESVIRAALDDARLLAGDVDAVEAHGTGTVLGDPIEAAALIATYGHPSSREHPLYIGSLKSNIGHAQAAAGIGGVIKMVGALRDGVLPRTLHVDAPSPHVNWSAGRVSLLAGSRPWPPAGPGRPRRAAVSSFGISGTNAHAILEQAPSAADAEQREPAPAEQGTGDVPPRARDGALRAGMVPWVVSAASADALRGQAENLRAFTAAAPAPVGDVGYSLGRTRAHLRYRAAVLGASREELRAGLAALAEGTPSPAVITGKPAGSTAFVFPGQGSQWPGMALGLLESSAAFRNRMAECADALLPYTGWSLPAVLRGEAGTPPLDRVDVVQPALFSVMVSLAAVWQSLGVRPHAVAGHSQGEIAAACVIGALSLDDAAKVVALRAAALRDLAGTGAMASVPLPVAQVRELLAGWSAGSIEVAAINGTHSTVVAGLPDAVRELVAQCRAREVRAREIDVDYASHTGHVAVLRDRLIADLADVTPRASETPLYSTVTGEPLDTRLLDAAYWYRNLRSTVRFQAATRAMLRDGHQVLIEVSPHPILTVPLAETAEDVGCATAVIGTLRRDRGDRDQFTDSLARAYVAGAPVRWEAVFPGARRVPLPTYAFRRQRFWLDGPGPAAGGGGAVTLAGLEATAHPLLGAITELPGSGAILLTGRVSLATHPLLADHRVSGRAVMSATTLLDLAVHAGRQARCERVAELTMEVPLVLPEHGFVQLRVMVERASAQGDRPLAIFSRLEGQAGHPWTRHASGAIRPGGAERGLVPDPAWPPAGAVPADLGDVYPGLSGRGYGYGSGFRGLRAAWRHGADLLAEVAIPEPLAGGATAFALHPVLLDSALHAFLSLSGRPGDGLRLPFSWSGVDIRPSGASRIRVRLAMSGADTVSMTATDLAGSPVAEVSALIFRAAVEGTPRGPGGLLLRLELPPLDGARPWDGDGARPPRCAVVDAAGAEVRDAGEAAPAWPALALPGPRFAGLQALRESIDSGADVPDLVFVHAARAAQVSPKDDVPAGAQMVALRTLELVQSWLGCDALAGSRLVVVTDQAMLDDADVGAVVQAPAWGLVRAAQAEHPGRLVLADVARGDAAALRMLPLAAGSGEPQVVLRDGSVMVPRLRAYSAASDLVPPPGASAWRLDDSGTRTIEGLSLIPCPQVMAPLVADQVRVSVRAAGLNFRDVTVALGLLPSERSIGIEGAGVVTEIGPEVRGLAPGDRVMGLFDGAFGPLAIASHHALVHVPDGWSFTEAASVPVTFSTAYQCLVEVAGVRPGEAVLVHAATGGVGLAAVQLATHLGAEVFATASSGKWSTLRAMGLADDHIASSRSPEFASKFRATTSGRGVDVVLNALAGELTDAGLGLLAPGGRLVEMGKTDLRDPARVAADYPGVSYHVYNLRTVRPAKAGQTLARVLALLASGAVSLPPVRAYGVRRARDAFTVMSRARHVGKIVLTMPSCLDPAGTVLITGGTGTLGRLLARHLAAAHGVRHLILAGRRGPAAEGAAGFTAELAALGATAEFVACDVASRAGLGRLIAGIPADQPLTAVIHAAGVIDDGIVASLTPDRLARVVRPKSDGAWHLHDLTRHLDLAAFVLFASVVGVLGQPGQANYAAANAALDALARYRQARGLPATALDWGVWAQRSGMTGHMADADLARFSREGIIPLPADEALRLFDAALATQEPVLVPVGLDVAGLAARESPAAVLRGLAAALAPVPPAHAAPAGPQACALASSSGAGQGGAEPQGDHRPLADRIAAMTADVRGSFLLELVCSEAAIVLGQADGEVAPDSTFRDLGVDSLTGLELRNRLNDSTGLRLPASVTTDNPTPFTLARFLGIELSARGNGTRLSAAP